MSVTSLSTPPQFTERTGESKPFVNPLMAILFAVELDALAARVRYAEAIAGSEHLREVTNAIGAHRERTTTRPWRTLPF